MLTVTELLRRTGVVGKFVEYFGDGVSGLTVADRATLGNMSPEYGATCGFFPVDELTLDYLRLTGRPERVALVEAYCRENLLWHEPDEHPEYSQVVELDLGDVEPSLAGPRRPQDRVPLARAKEAFLEALDLRRRVGTTTRPLRRRSRRATRRPSRRRPGARPSSRPASRSPLRRGRGRSRSTIDGEGHELGHGTVVIAAITSCTNTSNPQVMVAAGLLAKRAVELGLRRAPWVKTSLAPGSRVVTDYYERAGLQTLPRRARLQHSRLRLHDLHRQLGAAAAGGLAAIAEGDLVACAVLSGNRNFEARIHPR